MKKDNFSYKKAVSELEQIVADIESGQTDIDQLSEKVKRATELIQACKTKLRTTEEDIDNTMSSFGDTQA